MVNQDSFQELKNRILTQSLSVDSLSAKNPFLPHFPYMPRGQFPIVPPAVAFDTAAAFSYLAQITATANALHSSEYPTTEIITFSFCHFEYKLFDANAFRSYLI